MANNPLVEPDGAFLSFPADLTPGENITQEQAVVEISALLQDIVTKLNGELSLGTDDDAGRVGNLNAQRVHVIFGTANTERVIPHGLDRVPVGYVLIGADRACNVYDSATTAWDSVSISLKCDTADAKVRLWVF